MCCKPPPPNKRESMKMTTFDFSFLSIFSMWVQYAKWPRKLLMAGVVYSLGVTVNNTKWNGCREEKVSLLAGWEHI